MRIRCINNKKVEDILTIDKIYYRPDKKELPVQFVKDIINSFKFSNAIDPCQPYKIIINAVTVGCKEKL